MKADELIELLRDESNCDVLDYIDDAADLIEQQQKEIEWLANVIDKHQGETVPKLNEQLEQLKGEHRWIPVSEGLPENECKVLACYHFSNCPDMKFYQVLDYYAYDPQPHFQHERGFDGMKITHWQPLPELFKGEEE